MNIIGRPAVVVHFILIRGYNGVEITKEHGIVKTIVQLLLMVIGCVSGNHKPSPHKFDCPPKKVPGGMKEVMTCAAKFKFMLDQTDSQMI
ncbi:unnamed protein product [Oppiella nova]|uniref:Uncharacterized protein n=1 Tax=Oppiella nova TaxID=334625 RepID=A0A7R9LG18_9ACAR|nr:unnamed protein product [Oppiella nova]CAG2162558.1 unnamed protein product [Oppiella nova]